MKKLILLMSLILIVTLGGYSQLTPVKTTRVANATTAFGENVAVGSQVYDYGAEELYVCKTASASTLTLTTGAANFTFINPAAAVTNLSEGTTTNTTVDVNSSTGTNATIAAASTIRAGVMTNTKFDEVEVNNGKSTNVSTELSTGTISTTTYGITSDGGTDDIVIAAATALAAGVMTKAKFNEVVVNNGKSTNVSTDLSLGTRAATTMDVNSSDGNNVTLPAASTTEAGLLTDAQFDKLAGIEASANVNWTLFTEPFEEDDGTPTEHTLTYTAQTAGAIVSLNGDILKPIQYTFTSTTLTSLVPVLQYDMLVVTYNH